MPNQGKPRIESKVRREHFQLGQDTIAAGKTAQIELRVARTLSGSWLSLPVAVVHGAHDGPVIWLSAAIHGDELNGVPIIRRVLRGITVGSLRGTVIAVPIVNVFGLIEGSRYLPDRRDLNRSFPGSARGSMASQLAHLFMETIVKRCDMGIDLHTAAIGRSNLPQLRADLDHKDIPKLANAFGAPVSLHASLRDGSLRAAAQELRIPVLLYEAGEAGRFDSEAIRIGASGIMRVMAALGMIDAPSSSNGTVVSRSSTWIRAKRSGFCEMRVGLGSRVSQGGTLAVIFESLGKTESFVKASTSGIVIGCATAATVHRGEAVAHVAEV